jgi:hypothetical protein
VADVVEKLNCRTLVPGTQQSEPTQQAKFLKAALPGYLADAIQREGSFERRTGKAFAAKADCRFGKSGAHLKKGKLLNGRQQWEVVVPSAKGEMV